jgi:hypothetical protein
MSYITRIEPIRLDIASLCENNPFLFPFRWTSRETAFIRVEDLPRFLADLESADNVAKVSRDSSRDTVVRALSNEEALLVMTSP